MKTSIRQKIVFLIGFTLALALTAYLFLTLDITHKSILYSVAIFFTVLLVSIVSFHLGKRGHKPIEPAKNGQSEQGFRRLIEQMPYGICVLTDGLVSFVNPTFLGYLGFEKPEELLGRSIKELFATDACDDVWTKVLKVQDQAEHYRIESDLSRRDGQAVSMDLALLPVDFDRHPATFLLARDVTEEKQLRSSVIHAERMASVGTLAAGVSHEINNPLAYIIANHGFAQDELNKIQKEIQKLPKEWLAMIDLTSKIIELQEVILEAQEGADRVRRIVRDLKTFARDTVDEIKPHDVRLILESTINMALNQIRHRARLVKDFHDVHFVLASSTKLGQVFLNFLVNAAHAIEEGNHDNNTIRVTAKNADDNHVQVEISDTGCGIDKENLLRIFEPFFTTKPVGQGTGLGLYISFSIIESLGGEIHVDSTPNQGTTFRIILPACQKQPIHPPLKSTLSTNKAQNRARILIIEDEVLLGKAIARILNAHEVVIANEGKKALDLIFGKEAFDIILCDLLMPNMTGMDVFETVCKKAPELKNRFVFMTGSAFTTRAREFLANIPNLALNKPLDANHLRSIIQQYASGRH